MSIGLGLGLHLFVSYAPQDRQFVQELLQDLKHLGHEVWTENKSRGGQVWWDRVLAQIRACDAVLVAVSPGLAGSRVLAIYRGYAKRLGKPLLPVVIRPVSRYLLPPDLASLEVVDCVTTGPAMRPKLARALASLPRPTPLPDPLPDTPPLPIPTVGRVVACLVLLLGTTLLPFASLVRGGWSEQPGRSVTGVVVTLIVALALSLALCAEMEIPIGAHVPEFLLSALLLTTASVPSGLQRGSGFGSDVLLLLAGLVVLNVAWVLLAGFSFVYVKRLAWLTIVVAILLVVCMAASRLEGQGPGAEVAAGFGLLATSAVVGGVLLPYFWQGFKRVLACELRRRVKGPVPPGDLTEARLGSQRTAGLALGALASMLWLTISAAPSLGFVRGEGSGLGPVVLLSAAGCLTLVAALACRGLRDHWRVGLCLVAGLIWLLGTLRSAVVGFELRPLPILQLTLLSIWTWVALVTDVLVIQGKRIPRAALPLVAVCVTAVYVSGYWAVTAGLRSGSHHIATYPSSLLTLLLVCAVNTALVLAVGIVLASVSTTAAERPAGTVYGSTWILAMTQLSEIAAFIMLIWFPALVLTHVPAQTDERWLNIVSILSGPLLLLSPLLFLFLRTHTQHIDYESHLRLGTLMPQHHGLLSSPVGPSVMSAIRTSTSRSHGPVTSEEEWVQVARGAINIKNAMVIGIAFFAIVGLLIYLSQLLLVHATDPPPSVNATGTHVFHQSDGVNVTSHLRQDEEGKLSGTASTGKVRGMLFRDETKAGHPDNGCVTGVNIFFRVDWDNGSHVRYLGSRGPDGRLSGTTDRHVTWWTNEMTPE